jgi:hypothetical protein
MYTLNLYIDFAHTPPTWNCFDVLLRGELHRLDIGAERIKVFLIPGDNEGFRHDNLPPFGGAERMRWCKNIVAPMPTLLPSCGEPAVWTTRNQADLDPGPKLGINTHLHGFATNGDAARRKVFPFRATPTLTGGRPYVTITLRETGWHKGRQSDLTAWLKIGAEIERLGHDVIFIRDAATAHMPLGVSGRQYQAPPLVSECSDYRASMYAGAAMNLGIANGPLWFAWFMQAPVMIFDLIHYDEPCANEQSYSWGGLKPGDRGFPNSKATQALYWHKAHPDLVVAAFRDMMERVHA